MPGWSVIVHGGAGAIPGPLENAHREGCAAAVSAAVAVLKEGASALDAACAAVRSLEENPRFNAGTGAALDEDGLAAHDAAVMQGHDLSYGAVGAVIGVSSPIELAKAVLQDGRHCLLVGEGAVRFARRSGVALVDPAAFETEHSRAAWKARKAHIDVHGWDDSRKPWNPGEVASESDSLPSGNTVGAVVRTADGRTAAATSTGGLLMRYAGRVGDSPIAGAGTYARDDLGALSATGHGETMMRTVFAYDALLALRGTESPGARLRACLARATEVGGGRGGAIAILPTGEVVHARNTRGMGTAWQRQGDPIRTAFLPSDEDA